MESNNTTSWFWIVVGLLLALGAIFYTGLKPNILRYAYAHGKARLVPAEINFGTTESGKGYAYMVDGERYSSSFVVSREDIYWDSIDVLYLTSFPSYSIPAVDLAIKERKPLPGSFESANKILKEKGEKIKVKVAIDHDESRYAYDYYYQGCKYHKLLRPVGTNVNSGWLNDSVEIILWPANPNVQLPLPMLYEKDH